MILRVVTYAIIGVVLLPLAVILVTSFTADNYVSFPPASYSLRPYYVAFTKRVYFESFFLSLWIAGVTALISTALGTVVALGLVRYRFPGRDIVEGLFMSPLILPSVVVGIALLLYYSRLGLAASPVSLIFGHVIVTIPYAIRLVGTSLTGFDRTLELAARNLGASSRIVFLKVTLPLIRPGIVAGAIFAFGVSFDNVTISVFLATPSMVTLPVRIFSALDQPLEPWLVALCSLVMTWSALIILIIQRVVGVQGLFVQDRRA
jgi:putative spermidine/putrescine transport system permease protein